MPNLLTNPTPQSKCHNVKQSLNKAATNLLGYGLISLLYLYSFILLWICLKHDNEVEVGEIMFILLNFNCQFVVANGHKHLIYNHDWYDKEASQRLKSDLYLI